MRRIILPIIVAALSSLVVYTAAYGLPTPPAGNVPLCADESNSVVYHALYDPILNCHYDHEHHADPNTVNDLFGVPGAWFGQPGQSISYPWQTFNATTGVMENVAKHAGYKWIVERNLPCVPANPSVYGNGCVTAFRAQMHMVAGATDATVRYHSFSLEAQACLNGVCGTIHHGGWQDFGLLGLEGPNGTVTCPNIPSQPPDRPCVFGAPFRLHGTPQQSLTQVEWYAGHKITQVAARASMFGDIDPNNPNNQLFFCTDLTMNCHQNGSMMMPRNLFIDVGYYSHLPSVNGIVNFHGWTDRYGTIVTNCQSTSLDCVPLLIDNLPQAQYAWNGGTLQEFDTSPAARGTGSDSWIRFPN